MHAPCSSAFENFPPTGISVLEAAIKHTEIYMLIQGMLNTSMMQQTLREAKLV